MHKLDVLFFKKKVGELIQAANGDLSFIYDEIYYKSKNSVAISLSMPLSQQVYEGNIVKAFFSGLLPEDQIKMRLARLFKTDTNNDFALLEKIGGECGGAISLMPHNKKSSINLETNIDDKQLEKFFSETNIRPLLSFKGKLRLSLAGAQDKVPVCVNKTKKEEIQSIFIPPENQATTHIIKPAIKDFRDTSHNEYFCLELASKIGLNTCKSYLKSTGKTFYLIIERYDRINHRGQISRLHQEDLCQAYGLMPELKYQKDGGIGFQKCFDLISRHCTPPAISKLALLRAVIFNFLIGNNDAHAKNYSLIYLDKGKKLS